MIAQNAILRAWAQVLGFWYVVGLLVWWARADATLPSLPSVAIAAATQSALIMLVGAVLGILGALAYIALSGMLVERDLQRGARWYGMRVRLGEFEPHALLVDSGRRQARARGLLEEQGWWKQVAASPPHADAMVAVAALMLREPRLPASPYPGGHGGRTLIEHSLGVVESMLRMRPGFVYQGQYSKRGRLVVPLEDPESPIRFGEADVPLLALAAFAHDIGKLACYAPQDGGKPDDRTVPVAEVLPEHDTQGARLLRRVPAILALPRPDRDALIVACGYYHHPWGIPRSDWIDDRARALTELLIQADVATGKAEGHQLRPEDVQEDPEDAPPAKRPRDGGVPAVAPPEETDLDASVAGLPPIVLALRATLRQPGVIGGGFRSTTAAYANGGWVFVIEARMTMLIRNAMRRYVPDRADDDAFYARRGNNLSQMSAELLDALSGCGWLMQEHAGAEYGPRRALFRLKVTQWGKTMGGDPPLIAFAVREDALDLSEPPAQADAVEILGPYWGEASARNKSGAQAGAQDSPGAQGQEGEADPAAGPEPDAPQAPAEAEAVGSEPQAAPVAPTQDAPAAPGPFARAVAAACRENRLSWFAHKDEEGQAWIAIPRLPEHADVVSDIGAALLATHPEGQVDALIKRDVPNDDIGDVIPCWLVPADDG